MFLPEIAAFFVAYTFLPVILLLGIIIYWACLSDTYDSFPGLSYCLAGGALYYFNYIGVINISWVAVAFYAAAALIIAVIQIRVFDMRKIKKLIDYAMTYGYNKGESYQQYNYRWFRLADATKDISKQIEIRSLGWYLAKYILLAPAVLIDIIIGSFLRDMWNSLVQYTKRKVRAPIERYLSEALSSKQEQK